MSVAAPARRHRIDPAPPRPTFRARLAALVRRFRRTTAAEVELIEAVDRYRSIKRTMARWFAQDEAGTWRPPGCPAHHNDWGVSQWLLDREADARDAVVGVVERHGTHVTDLWSTGDDYFDGGPADCWMRAGRLVVAVVQSEGYAHTIPIIIEG